MEKPFRCTRHSKWHWCISLYDINLFCFLCTKQSTLHLTTLCVITIFLVLWLCTLIKDRKFLSSYWWIWDLEIAISKSHLNTYFQGPTHRRRDCYGILKQHQRRCEASEHLTDTNLPLTKIIKKALLYSLQKERMEKIFV